jgi:hypothetical protein
MDEDMVGEDIATTASITAASMPEWFWHYDPEPLDGVLVVYDEKPDKKPIDCQGRVEDFTFGFDED